MNGKRDEMNDHITKIMDESIGPKTLSEDVFKIAEVFALETGQEFLLRFYRERCDKKALELQAKKAYALAMLQLLDSIRDTVPMKNDEKKESN